MVGLLYKKRPRLKPEFNRQDQAAELIGWSALVCVWLVVLFHYASLPEIIPIHFNAKGEADGFGLKTHLFTLPAVATVLFVLLTLLNKIPYRFNYLVEITESNAKSQYTHATRLIRYLKLGIVLVVLGLVFITLKAASETSPVAKPWMIPLILGIVFLPMLFFVGWAFRNK